MCLFSQDEIEPDDRSCKMKSGGNNLIVRLSDLNPAHDYKLKIHPTGKQTDDGSYAFSIIQTTQLSETILSAGVWTDDSGKFLSKVYIGYFPSSSKLVSLFMETEDKEVFGLYHLVSLEKYPDIKGDKIGPLKSGQFSSFMNEEIIAAHCDPKTTTIVALYKPVRPET